MTRRDSHFVCQQCGHAALAWTGRCPGCGEWNTLAETLRPGAEARGAGASGARRRSIVRRGRGARPVPLRDVEAPATARLLTGIAELDRVLGGGLVPGSLVLLGGSPGIGKSTLTGMALGNLGAAGAAGPLRLRARSRPPRCGCAPSGWATTRWRSRCSPRPRSRPCSRRSRRSAPTPASIDSIQTLHAEGMTGAPGSVGQVREAAAAIMEVAKRLGTAVVLVGHVTKDGTVAGPRALEHLVDCVLLFEGERERSFRTLRALKNRFGATSEVGVFEMRSGGLVEVADPSARFVGEASEAPGSCVLCAMEGTRPLLVEVQALVAPTEIVPPRRVATGIDRNRLAMVLAVLARHGGPSLASADVFVNVAGGVRVEEPGADLAVALALASAHRGEPLRGGGKAAGLLRRGRPDRRAPLRRPP